LLATALAARTHAAEFVSGRSSFTVDVDGETLDYHTLAVSCLPGALLRITIPLAGPNDRFDLQVENAERPVRVAEKRIWQWRAPETPGMREILVVREATGATLRVRVFVLTPWSGAGSLNGYSMGAYPAEPLRGLPAYVAPRGFIEVRPADLDVPVSPHFRLRQFLCKQAGGYPKYVLVRTRLVRWLERLLERLNEAGHSSDTLFVMSAFRTPVYNAALRDTLYSRHQWGDAADIYPDADGDGRIDDLDGNGKSNDADADYLYAFINSLAEEPEFRAFTGGNGRYGNSRSHPPFVHVDTRGYQARWRD
jgi:hypothetical protein